MRSLPLVVGGAVAILAAAVVAPTAGARPAFFLDGTAEGPLGSPDDWTTNGLVMDDVPLLPSNTVFIGGFCFVSSEIGMFCASHLPVFEPPPPRANDTLGAEEAVPETVEGPEGVVPEEEDDETPVTQPPHEVADAGAPGPLEPQPEAVIPATDPEDPIVPMSTRTDLPGVNWAVVTAAIALPWAVGLKILATLLGLRRAGKLAGGEAARSSLRGAVLEAVAREPGIRHSDLVARIGRGNGTVEHHVRALLAEGRVARVRGHGSTLYFPAGAAAETEGRLRLALQGSTSRRMAQAIAARPGIRLGDLARELGISGATAHYQAGKLVRAGVVVEQPGPGRRFALTEAARPCLATLALAPPQAEARPPPVRPPALVPDATAA